MSKVILLVEDNATDEKLALRACEKSGVTSEIVVLDQPPPSPRDAA